MSTLRSARIPQLNIRSALYDRNVTQHADLARSLLVRRQRSCVSKWVVCDRHWYLSIDQPLDAARGVISITMARMMGLK
ncbi:hypothetical protein FRC02_003526 [Tulasnella sp. 418]|nr:hypothetical protein FRC02_003526 [Tulasnella sp. 418]